MLEWNWTQPMRDGLRHKIKFIVGELVYYLHKLFAENRLGSKQKPFTFLISAMVLEESFNKCIFEYIAIRIGNPSIYIHKYDYISKKYLLVYYFRTSYIHENIYHVYGTF